MYALAFGRDRIGGGTAQSQYNAGTKTSSPVPGDLVFFGSSSSSIVHVGVVVGNDLMINAYVFCILTFFTLVLFSCP